MLDVLFRLGITAGLALAAYLLTRFLLARFALPLLRRHRPDWAQPVERSRLPMLVALLAAAIAIYFSMTLLAQDYPQLTELMRYFNSAAGIALVAFILATVASIALAIYEQHPMAREVPLRGLVQLVQAFIFLVGGLMLLMSFLGVPVIYSFTALAAIFTVLGFVFQDPIMGFIAGIQLAANKMIAIGDWIEVPQFGANGAVQEILMSTVKVRNWDNTVTTVPARALISDSFKNWRPMALSGGRRLQRAVLLDVHSVRPLSPELAARFPVLAETWRQVQVQRLPTGDVLVADARQEPTNLGIYRAYMSDYLLRHPSVNQEMVKMVRQLPPDENGVPLELTVYIVDTDWVPFENTSSSVFEHVYATLPQFGLRPFQRQLSVDIGDPQPQGAAQP